MLRGFVFSSGVRLWLNLLILVLGLNVIFLALSFTSNLVPQETIVRRVRHAFATDELIDSDYLPYDTRRGWHQYNDCNILQMMSNPDFSITGRALGPWIHSVDLLEGSCRNLRELVINGIDPTRLVSARYTRYWHGYIPVISMLLTFQDISTVRTVLRASVYMSVMLLLLAGVRRQAFLPLAGSVAIAGTFFWGLPYFGQGMSHALGDVIVMLGIACLIFFHNEFAKPERLLAFCALFGSAVVYFEMLTGPLPTAAGLLFPTVYLISRLNTDIDTQNRQHFKYATAALIAFGLGAALTVVVKIAITAVFVQPSGLDVFLGNLSFYTKAVDRGLPIPVILQPLGRLVRKGVVLTYGSNWGLVALYVSALGALFTSLWLAWKQGSRLGWVDLSAFTIGMGIIPIWTFILPNHTFIHAGFMARILIVPISLSWAMLFWLLYQNKTVALRR